MTRLEVIKANKEAYSKFSDEIKNMAGIQKAVAENITLAWIKGVNWMGGLGDSKAQRLYEKVEKLGYSLEEIDEEFIKQTKQAYEFK